MSRFLNFDKCSAEVAGDVISVVAEEQVGMKVRVKLGDSTLYSGGIIRHFAGKTPYGVLPLYDDRRTPASSLFVQSEAKCKK